MLEVVLFPSSYFRVNKVDEDWQAEYEAVVETGLYEVALFGYEKWFQEGKLVLNRSFDKVFSAVYRGWMMKPETVRCRGYRRDRIMRRFLGACIRVSKRTRISRLFPKFRRVFDK